MRSITENLTQNAAYQRDRRNIATHFVGVPMIVFAIVLALATARIPNGGPFLALSVAVSAAACVYYLLLDLKLGISMVIVLAAMCAGANLIVERMGIGGALGAAVAIFVVGWVIQFVGHKYEGVKPAFFDDAKQLLIGPLFVCAEAYFLLGARNDLRRYIEDRVGPTCARRDGRAIPIFDEPVF
jgi:uncharacterized membrane protein YGL010W